MILQKSDLKLYDIIQRAEEIFGKLYSPEHTYEAILNDERDQTEIVDRLIDHPPELSTIFAYVRGEVDELLLQMSK